MHTFDGASSRSGAAGPAGRFEVRRQVAGRDKSRSFITWVLADSYRAAIPVLWYGLIPGKDQLRAR